ncbi:hypothetical protein FA15DRAFT_708059 [Coprinopsis marcescibilis]|uniref:Uncharacterized protein n=1 Tax=Coprinopsis marcescibilis TaxID=230819 RepID=A0A5C3KJN2_COPMA|nr:hypothetical protein FA15DRAFT_708059 [Coprinopsis marcescibilis]
MLLASACPPLYAFPSPSTIGPLPPPVVFFFRGSIRVYGAKRSQCIALTSGGEKGVLKIVSQLGQKRRSSLLNQSDAGHVIAMAAVLVEPRSCLFLVGLVYTIDSVRRPADVVLALALQVDALWMAACRVVKGREDARNRYASYPYVSGELVKTVFWRIDVLVSSPISIVVAKIDNSRPLTQPPIQHRTLHYPVPKLWNEVQVLALRVDEFGGEGACSSSYARRSFNCTTRLTTTNHLLPSHPSSPYLAHSKSRIRHVRNPTHLANILGESDLHSRFTASRLELYSVDPTTMRRIITNSPAHPLQSPGAKSIKV